MPILSEPHYQVRVEGKPAIRSSRIPFILSGLLTVLAYPPVNLWPLAWVSLVPLIRQLRNLPLRLAFRRGWWAGLIFNTGLLYWIALNSGADFPLAPLSLLGLLLIMPLYWAVFAAIWTWLYRRWGSLAALLLPAVWVGLEVLKNAPEIAFPWQELGLSQIGFLPMVQIAELGGIRLISAWVVLLNVALFLLLDKRRSFALILFTLLAVSPIWGWWRMNHLPLGGPPLTVALIQGNVDPDAKWTEDAALNFSLYEKLTREAISGSKPDLILWPETALPVYLGHQLEYQRRLRNFVREIGAPVLTGAPHYELRPGGGPIRYNSAFFFPKDGSPPLRYDKIRLVPFGERVPFQRWFPKLGELNLGQAEFTPGKQRTVFELSGGVKVAPQICFESVFSEEIAPFAANGARVIANMTNDGWYGNSSGPYQHAELVRFRSIESRYPLVRAANTGISLAVDRAGHVVDRLPYGVSGLKLVTVQSGGPETTFYLHHGELIPRVLACIALLGLILCRFLPGKGERT
jgi:apolipoprotein N-acyltransferase